MVNDKYFAVCYAYKKWITVNTFHIKADECWLLLSQVCAQAAQTV